MTASTVLQRAGLGGLARSCGNRAFGGGTAIVGVIYSAIRTLFRARRHGDVGIGPTSTAGPRLAIGVRYRRLDVPGLDRLEPASVYYAATENEARLCTGDPVTIVDGGNSAGQAAVFLARQAAAVNLVIRHDDLYRDMSRYLADRVLHT